MASVCHPKLFETRLRAYALWQQPPCQRGARAQGCICCGGAWLHDRRAIKIELPVPQSEGAQVDEQDFGFFPSRERERALDGDSGSVPVIKPVSSRATSPCTVWSHEGV